MGNNHTLDTTQVYRLADELLQRISKVINEQRYFLGLTGGPAAGKSTLASRLAEAVNHQAGEDLAIVIPMDGFHLRNVILQERGLRSIKGAAETFDADGFVELLRRLHETPKRTVMCPAYDRQLHDPVMDAITVNPRHRLIIVEGNYLLFTGVPWSSVRPQLDEVWYLETPRGVAVERLLHRHMTSGLTLESAKQKIDSTDLPNAHLIETTRKYADRVIYTDNGMQRQLR